MNERSQAFGEGIRRRLFAALTVVRVALAVLRPLTRVFWAVFLVWAALMAAQSVPYYVYFDEGATAFRQGDFLRAQELLEEAFREAKHFGENDRRYNNAVLALAELYSDECKYPAAEQKYQALLDLYGRKNKSTSVEAAVAMQNLAYVYIHEQRWAAAEALLYRALALQEHEKGKESPAVATVVHGLALLSERKGDIQAADGLFRRAIAIWENAGSKPKSQLAAAYCDYRRLLLSEKRDQDADRVSKEAGDVGAEMPGDLRRQVAHLVFLVTNQIFDANGQSYEYAMHWLVNDELAPSASQQMRLSGYLPEDEKQLQARVAEISTKGKDCRLQIDIAYLKEPDKRGFVPAEISGRTICRSAQGKVVRTPFRLRFWVGVNPQSKRPVVAEFQDLRPIKRAADRKT